MAQWRERRTLLSGDEGWIPGVADAGMQYNLGPGQVIHTYLLLSPSSKSDTGQTPVMPYGWEGNRRPGRKKLLRPADVIRSDFIFYL